MSRPSVLLLCGGPDAEYAVSLTSAKCVAAALQADGVDVHQIEIDRLEPAALSTLPGEVIFPMLHGPWGEGGPLQEILEQDGRPYVGSGPAAASRCMDKSETKHLARTLGVPTPDWQLVHAPEDRMIAPPLVVKPNDDGSSVDVCKCHTCDEVATATQTLLSHRPEALLERLVVGRELTVGWLDGEILPIVEIRPSDGWYDYAAKYDRSDTAYETDPPLPAHIRSEVVSHTQAVCEALEVRDLARVDFLLDADRPWLLEVNTMPGFTDHSLFPMAAAARGLDMTTLCSRLVETAAARSRC